VARVQHVRKGDLLVARADGDLHPVGVDQQADLFDQIVGEQSGARDADR
jgi:hypothetical protein